MTVSQPLLANHQHLEKYRKFLPLALLLLGGCIGYAAFRPGGIVALSYLMPILWLFTKSRFQGGMLFFGYFIASARHIPGFSQVFFADTRYPLTYGILILFAAATLHAAPWAIVRIRRGGWYGLLGLIAVFALHLLPPAGLVSAFSPFMSAGWLLPGTGLIGLILLTMSYLAIYAFMQGERVFSTTVASIFVMAVLLANSQYQEPAPIKGIVALNTSLPGCGNLDKQDFGRVQTLIDMSEAAMDAGAKTVILPETVACREDGALSYYWAKMMKTQRESATMVMVGAMPIKLHSKGRIKLLDSALIFSDGDYIGKLNAYQPVPIGSWHPWSDPSYEANWLPRKRAPIVFSDEGLKSAGVLICYDELLPIPVLLEFAVHQPQVMIVMVNNWWDKEGPITDLFPDRWRDIQLLHGTSWARLYGVPMYRASNG